VHTAGRGLPVVWPVLMPEYSSDPQFTVMMTEVLSPPGSNVAPASSLLTILTWFGTF
jgi:hypothetical protein